MKNQSVSGRSQCLEFAATCGESLSRRRAAASAHQPVRKFPGFAGVGAGSVRALSRSTDGEAALSYRGLPYDLLEDLLRCQVRGSRRCRF